MTGGGVNRLGAAVSVSMGPGAAWITVSGLVMARLRRLLSDLRRIVGGSLAFLGYLLTGHRVEIGLGRLSTDSTIAEQGRQNRYLVTISNARIEPREVTLVIDIYADDATIHADRHYAHFSKRLTAPARASLPVDIRYDWRTNACFMVDDLPLPPDHLWRGTLDRSARYSVNAILLDPSGTRLELLTVYQKLSP